MKARLLSLLLTSTLLGGCAAAPLVVGVGAAAGGVMVANDRRTAGTMVDDERIEINALDLVARDPMLREHAHINATSFNGQLLLTGEVPSQMSKDQLAQQAARLQKVTVVKNELVVGTPSDSNSRTIDTATTSRVKSRLLSELKGGLGNHIKVITESGTVYLMGLVSKSEADQAVAIARTTKGVQRIVKVFEYQP
jgi:osmotically-inducible protein OsmY